MKYEMKFIYIEMFLFQSISNIMPRYLNFQNKFLRMDPDPNSEKFLDPDSHTCNADPHTCFATFFPKTVPELQVPGTVFGGKT